MGALIFIIILFFIITAIAGVKVINQYERGVVFTLGKYSGILQPGLAIVWPYIQTVQKVDIRTQTMDVPKQEVITKDNVTVNIDAVVYFRVEAPDKAVLQTQNFRNTTSQFALTAMRDVTGSVSLDDLLGKREEISNQIKSIVDAQTAKWGIDVEAVKLQSIELPNDMKRAMAKEAEAERERRANVISAEGEKQASETLAEAAKTLANSKGAIELRTLNTLERISVEPSQKTIIMVPSTLLDKLQK